MRECGSGRHHLEELAAPWDSHSACSGKSDLWPALGGGLKSATSSHSDCISIADSPFLDDPVMMRLQLGAAPHMLARQPTDVQSEKGQASPCADSWDGYRTVS